MTGIQHVVSDEFFDEDDEDYLFSEPMHSRMYNPVFMTLQFLKRILYRPENLFVLLCSEASTLFFCLYIDPHYGYPLAAQIRFDFIATAVLFPAVFMASETTIRRESSMRRFASVKGHLSQIFISLLTWRAPKIKDMGEEWESFVYHIVVEYATELITVLTLPTLRIRHTLGLSTRGTEFVLRVHRRRRFHLNRLAVLGHQLHVFVEELKERGLTPQESIRLYQYLYLLSKDVEGLFIVKFYRTGEAARSFVRVVLFVCILFYGPYYSFVAGNLISSTSGDLVVFSCFLTLVSTMALLSLVGIQRALEDPFAHGSSTLNMPMEIDRVKMNLAQIATTWADKKKRTRI